MRKYLTLNNLAGIAVLLISFLTYFLTVEPTVSFWDCGEFIASAYKLQVGHPPGAPFYMLVARIFSLLAFGNTAYVALAINTLSVVVSAFTVYFLYLTLLLLGKKIAANSKLSPENSTLLTVSSAVVGALAYNFTDTFWFSAVEAEVYAFSSLFTAVVFWAILKWEEQADEPGANRWLILISYLMGLSIGVHLLNLLAIPAIVFVYWFRKFEYSRKGLVYTTLVAILLLGFVVYGVIPGFPGLAAKFELLFVNSLGLPVHSGLGFFLSATVIVLSIGIYYTVKKRKVLINTILTALAVMLIGYGSYATIVIRSNANTPMNENAPDNIFALLSYLNREQYGDRPLVYGQQFNSPSVSEEKQYTWYFNGAKYYKVELANPKINYHSDFNTFFPRMYSSQQSHVRQYESWTNFKGTPTEFTNRHGEQQVVNKPTFFENISFFVKYQVGHMYFRYFFWNFAGRQNDIQSQGSLLKGNWVSGFAFLDDIRLGNSKLLPEQLKKDASRNVYFLLPLLLGLFGAYFQFLNRKFDFYAVLLLFLLTGLAIVVYLNQTPIQARERDYAYAGSFYAFAVWIGFGVFFIFELLQKWMKPKLAIIAAFIVSLTVPSILAIENYDDHNRANRYSARDIAINHLESCERNAILFTYGDNDTFPLWYVQEVEGIRTDVRVINLSLLGTDWYIKQMCEKKYDSEAIDMTIPAEKYEQGKRDVVLIMNQLNDVIELKDLVTFAGSDLPQVKIKASDKSEYNFFPSKNIKMHIDSAAAKAGFLTTNELTKLDTAIVWQLSQNYFSKSDLAVYDIIATNAWKRPIYFASGSPTDAFLGLTDYFRLEGFAYRFVPVKSGKMSDDLFGYIDTDRMFKNVSEKFSWGNLDKPNVFVDYQNFRVLNIVNVHEIYAQLAIELASKNALDNAQKVAELLAKALPIEKIPLDYKSLKYIEALYMVGLTDLAKHYSEVSAHRISAKLAYFSSIGRRFESSVIFERRNEEASLKRIVDLADQYGELDFAEKLRKNSKMMN